MQAEIGLLTGAASLSAGALFLLGLAIFRGRPSAAARELRATMTMWAAVISVAALLCCAGTLLFPLF